MTRNRYIRKKRGSTWDSKGARLANKVRWDADRARRDAEMPDRVMDIRRMEIENLPRKTGDVLGVFQWTSASTGKVRRWVVRIGDRVDQITVEFPGEVPSRSGGWSWLMTKLRKHILNQ